MLAHSYQTDIICPILEQGWPKKIVQLVYFDESGTGSIKEEATTVVAAVLVHGDDQAREINRESQALCSSLKGNRGARFEFKADKIFRH
jgi:hypothetical protein